MKVNWNSILFNFHLSSSDRIIVIWILITCYFCFCRVLSEMSFPNSHKTVFLLDRSSAFHESSKQPVDFDMFMKAKAPGLIPLAPISKSLWTCNVEAVLEYVRIVYDVFPFSKLVSFKAKYCIYYKSIFLIHLQFFRFHIVRHFFMLFSFLIISRLCLVPKFLTLDLTF